MGDLKVLAGGFLEDGLVGEARQSRSHIILPAHLKVLAEVLVTAPPVQVDHSQSLVSPHLMEVRVSDIVLNTVDWESSVSVAHSMEAIGLSDSVPPVLNQSLLSVLLSDVKEERAEEMESNQEVENSEPILSVEWIKLPVYIAKWIFVEARNVFGNSISLSIISWFVHVLHKFGEVSISLLGQCTKEPNEGIN